MVEAKVPETTIISQIRSSKTNFDLSTAGVIQLTKGGVKGNIIEVMRAPKADVAAAQRTAQLHPPTPPAAPPTKSASGQSMPLPVESQPAALSAPVLPPPPVQAPPPLSQAQTVPTRIHTVSILGGMPFNITLAQDVPLKLTAGQKINFVVSKDVKVGEFVVIAKGTPLSGEVVDPGDSKKLLIVKNKATFKLTSVESTGGTRLAIRAIPGKRADDKVDRPIEQQGTKNKDVLAPAGTEYLGYVENDQTVTLKR